ncbi:MAG: FMN-binding glutamate synthase family protein [Actinobacteria bacterium]|nr:FMN-binding glutamate synthase family protein [Thermoleophilia bacterium]MCB9010423.1 FMN-binding glutamate synthase family protein [Actinomycetota bacterium]
MPAISVLTVVTVGLALTLSWWWAVAAVPAAFLLAVGLYDLVQPQHSILRNFPILGHGRFYAEGLGPEMRQYFVESNTGGRPFSRDQRTLMYQRSKNIEAVKAFGTEVDVYAEGYGFLAHSIEPRPVNTDASRAFRIPVGGPACTRPYDASVLNISAMSFGALSGAAITALNTAAERGGFAHNTGEGGISRYHREAGGDLVWQIGTGYFGCRDEHGGFDGERFAAQATQPNVKMIELKISQGAKPGHGGMLPGAKVTREIADAREVPVGVDCISPPGHSTFSTPVELLQFVARLRELSGGKPVGFKLAVGDPGEFFAICKAMRSTGLTPDFITVDGGEGGTGAAPLEYSDHLGMPMREALILVHNALVLAGVREHVRVAASGKRIDSYDIASAIALGADWVNVARGFMFALGCIQSQRCHTNTCPVGIATQDAGLQRALVIGDKAERVLNFHRNTVKGLAQMTAACGLDHPSQFVPALLFERTERQGLQRLDSRYDVLPKRGPIDHNPFEERAHLAVAWSEATPDRFRPPTLAP